MTRLHGLGLSLCFVSCALFSHPKSIAADSGAKTITGGSFDASLRLARFEEPLLAVAPTSSAEDMELAEAVSSYNARGEADDLSALAQFISKHPDSGWNVSVLTNLGLLYYHYGYFQKAIDSWHSAWESGKQITDPHARVVVDRAVGELARMHARLGHADELSALFAEMGDRHVSGDATEAIDGAKDGLWLMRNHPGTAYLCGPMALKNLLLALNVKPEKTAFLDDYRSGPHGVSLEEVSSLADKAQFAHRIVFREPGQPIPVPSIVHWKVAHFAAIISEANGRYHLADPTFGRDLWVTRAAIDAEGSGYFLVPVSSDRQPSDSLAALRKVDLSEASQVRGMGVTTLFEILATLLDDVVCVDCIYGVSQGMATYNMHEMLVSLHISDTPVGYTPPKGPAVNIMLVYNQREAAQPALYEAFNISQKWSLNWLAYIEDDPFYPGAGVTRYAAGGGSVDESGYNSATQSFTAETRDASVLVLKSLSPIVYQRMLADGGMETYAQSDGSTGSTRHIFLTQITDPQGNSVSLNYDSQLRLTSITDATGRSTTFSYGLTGYPLLVTQITDPFGRSASLSYNSLGLLTQITDVLGLTSQFTYDASLLIDAMTTPYGTTNFAYGDNGNERYLNVTDPLGYTERLEYLQQAPGIAYSDPPALIPQRMTGPWNNYLYGRDTWYWDKHAYPIAAGDYTQARNRHWTHQSTNLNITSHTVEAIKYPLENRVWMNYTGQSVANLSSAESGTFDTPTNIGRVLDDGTTQLSQRTYNSLGHVTDFIDPVGRETQFIYNTNQIDVLQVKQKIAASGYSTIAQFAYNSQHLPLTYTDAAGQTSTYQYNTAGQLTQSTDALAEITKYNYDALGYLTSIINPNGKTQATFTYDAYGRIATATDSEGYTVSYNYDNLDRITKETFPDGTTRQYTWNRLDLASVKDRQNNVTQYAHDAVRNLTQITDPLGHQTNFTYYENQTLKSLIDPNGNATTWNIDLQSRVTAKIYADGSQVTNAYENTTSRLHSVTDAMKQVKEYAYAEDDALTGITYENAVNATPNVSFNYDPYFKRVASMTDGTGATQYSYYPAGVLGALQLASEAVPEPQATITYQYDPLMRLTSRAINGVSETYSYDRLSRLTSHGTQMGDFQLGYLGQTGQLTSQMIASGTVGTTWSYDSNLNDRRLKAISNTGDSRSYTFTTTPENLISEITQYTPGYEYGSGNDWDSKQQEDNQWTYKYDDDYRLISALSSRTGVFKYEYDPADNITLFGETRGQETGTYNALNEIISFGQKPFIYDANGNVLDDGLRTYEWDAESRLLTIAWKSNVGHKTALSYDGLGRRIAIDYIDANRSDEVRYLWCGEVLCQSANDTNTIEHRYYSEGEYLPSDGSGLYYAQDQLGSVRDVLLTSDGRRVESSDFDPYGQSRKHNQTMTDFRYARTFDDKQDDVYLTHQRAYEPANGRWLSRDPITPYDDVNPYVYVRGGPVSHDDPSGLASSEVTVGGQSYPRAKGVLNYVSNCFGVTVTGDPDVGFEEAVMNRILRDNYSMFLAESQLRVGDLIVYYVELSNGVYVPSHAQRIIGFKNGAPLVFTRDGEYDEWSAFWNMFGWSQVHFGPLFGQNGDETAIQDPMANGIPIYYHPKGSICPCTQ